MDRQTNPQHAEKKDTPHCIQMENRQSLSVSGVSEVEGYDEHYVRAMTAQGILTVEGEMLHMQSLDLQKGEMQISGKIGALAYSDAVPKGEGGFFARLFR